MIPFRPLLTEGQIAEWIAAAAARPEGVGELELADYLDGTTAWPLADARARLARLVPDRLRPDGDRFRAVATDTDDP